MPDNTLFNPQMYMQGPGLRHLSNLTQRHPGLPGAPDSPPAGDPAANPDHLGFHAMIQQYRNSDNSGSLRSALGDFHNALGDWHATRPDVLAVGARSPAYQTWRDQRPNLWNYLHPQAPGTPAAPGTPTTPPLTNPGVQVGPVNALPQMGNVGSSYGVIGANPAANPYGLPTY